VWIKKSGKWTFAADEEDIARAGASAELSRIVSAGCSEQAFAGLKCPVCPAPLSLSVHPLRHVFFLACRSSTRHLAVHDEFTQRKDWHQSYVTSTSWLDAEPLNSP